jgi:hypothetical protein
MNFPPVLAAPDPLVTRLSTDGLTEPREKLQMAEKADFPHNMW